MPRNMLIGQSGGPTVAINASLAGAVEQAMRQSEIGGVYGALNGIEGVLHQRFIDLRKELPDTESLRLLKATPSMALGSCRHKLPPPPNPVYGEILDTFRKFNIGYFFYIGGNDSMDTVARMSAICKENGEDIRCVGIPKTVDNDLPCTDHTPGFGSAARYIATSVAEVARDNAVYDMPSITIVEIMGRNAGWLTASAALARQSGPAPHLIYLPETPFDPDQFIGRIRELSKDTPQIVVAVSEGIRFAGGEYVSASGDKVDAFGHKALAGAGRYLESLVKEKLGSKVRSVELNVLQRAAAHLQSAVDIDEAVRLGAEAVRAAVEGQTGVMAAVQRVSQEPYLTAINCVDIRQVANLEKTIPLEWIDTENSFVTQEMVDYLLPLVSDGTGNGLPRYITFGKGCITPDQAAQAVR